MSNRIRILSTAALAGALTAAPVGAAGQQSNPPQTSSQPQQTQQQTADKSGQAQQQMTPATPVRLSNIEGNSERYLGQRITVSGEVEEVLGPRVFKVDERNWWDFDRELLVVMDAPLAALVKEDDPVTVTGTLRRFADVRVEREWGWFTMDPEIEARVRTRPVLVATSVVGTDPNVGMYVTVRSGLPPQADQVGDQGRMTRPKQTGQTGQMGQTRPGQTGQTGTTGRPATAAADTREALTDAAALAKSSDNTLVGRRVSLSSVRVDRTIKPGGFWVNAGGEELFVLPAEDTTRVQAGQNVTIEGYVLRLPEQMERRLERKSQIGNEEIYVYATSIK